MRNLAFLLPLVFSVSSYAQQEFVTVSGCEEADYVLADSVSSVAFAGMDYTPRCLKVEIGSQVTIAASKRHPLLPQLPSPLNPIVETEETQSFEFNEPGFFGYFCDAHGTASGTGMAGTIWVVESF